MPVVQFWKSFDLNSTRLLLDGQGIEIQSMKEQCQKSRKKLAETTKAFRRCTEEEKLTSISSLLKSYQEEIDRLTKRAKCSETAFFNLYKSLHEAPDPVPALERRIESDSESELRARILTLEQELKDYDDEVAGLKNQDITIRHLQETINDFENNIEDMVQKKVDEQVKDLTERASDRVDEAQQRQDEAERRCVVAQERLQEALANLDTLQSEVFELRQGNENQQSQYQGEVDIVAQEALRLRQLELENAELRRKLDTVPETASTFGIAEQNELRGELEHKDSVIMQLRDDLIQQEASAVEYQKEMARHTQQHQEQMTAIQHQLEVLKLRPTHEQVDSLEKKMATLQRLGLDVDGGDAVVLEESVFSRLNKFETEWKEAQSIIETDKRKLIVLEEELESKQSTIDRQRVLITKLEEDVATGAAGTQNLDKNAQLLSGVLSESQASTHQSETEGSAVDPAMLSIIRDQRDRYRDRMKEMETERNQANENATRLKTTLKRLENDNMQLYTRIRYLESYQEQSAHKNARSTSNQQLEEGNMATERRYKSMYDEKMNPFAQFSKAESQQRYSNLNVVDKVLLTSAQMILGHKITRTIAFVYLVALHFLVFSTLYMFMHMCGVSND